MLDLKPFKFLCALIGFAKNFSQLPVFLLIVSFCFPIVGKTQIVQYHDSLYCGSLSQGQHAAMITNPLLVHVRIQQDSQLVDTLFNRFALHGEGIVGAFLKEYPSQYIYLSNTGFVLQASQLHGVGLHLGLGQSFAVGDTVCYGYYRNGQSGKFLQDYTETMMGNFVNHQDSSLASVKPVLTSDGVVLIANKNLSTGDEVTACYHKLLAVFGNDPVAISMIKFW